MFLTNDSSIDMLDRDILYSILDKRPKRARTYWFLNVRVTDEPFTHTYSVNTFGTDFVFKVQLNLGFKMNQRVNSYLRQVVADMVDSGEMVPQGRPYSIYRDPGVVGDFRFSMIRKVLSPDTDVSQRDYRTMNAKYAIRSWCGSPAQWYGLENSSIIFETVPIFRHMKQGMRLDRVDFEGGPSGAQGQEADASDEDIFTADMARSDAAADEVASSLIGGATAKFEAQGRERHRDFDL